METLFLGRFLVAGGLQLFLVGWSGWLGSLGLECRYQYGPRWRWKELRNGEISIWPVCTVLLLSFSLLLLLA